MSKESAELPPAHDLQSKYREANPAERTPPVAAPQPKQDQFVHFFAGGIAGCVGAFATQPLDVLRTRLQASNKTQSIQMAASSRFFTRTIDSLRFTFQREGFHGLFRGLGPNLVGIAPSRAIYFSAYNAIKEFLGSNVVPHGSPANHLISAGLASMVTATTMNPLWVVKTRIQLAEYQKQGSGYNGMLDCVRTIKREEGFKGFYKGLTASYVGAIETAFYWAIYEKTKMMLKESKFRQNPTEYKSLNDVQFTPTEYLVSSGLCKLLASTLAYPHEVMRTRMRERVDGVFKYQSLAQTFRVILKEEGVRGLYSGMGTHLIRVVPNTAIMFLAYEFIVDYFANQKNRQ